MHLKSYLNLYQLLENDKSSREENRAFGLAHVLLKEKPVEQLVAWQAEHLSSLKKPLISETFSAYMYGISLTLSIIALVVGIVSGIGLLGYSGHEPVNVIYFMAMVVFVPLFTMTLALLSMLRANRAQSMLVHISPAFWMAKILSFLPKKVQHTFNEVEINPLLLNWIVIKRSQVIALFFSIGLLLALLGMVVTQDIAFAWSTTLHISAASFHHFLYTLALPWRELAPWAVPSIELIEQSQYFRLGDKLSDQMIANASLLGEWWKFLAFATLFYAIILRFVMFLIASWGLKHAIKKSFLTLRGAVKLLREMNEPIITTHALHDEVTFVPTKENYGQILNTLDSSYDVVQGWAISKENLVVLCDSMKVMAPKFFEAGGINTLDEDSEIIAKSNGEVLFFVKGWEPPTMDFVDYLEALSAKVDKVVLVPVGTTEDHYEIDPEAVDVWDRKLSDIHNQKVWLKR